VRKDKRKKERGMRSVFLAIVLISFFGYLEGDVSFSGRCGLIKVGSGAFFDVNSHLDIDEGGFQIDNGGTLSASSDTYLSFSQGTFKHYDYETYMTGTIDINHATHGVRLRDNGDIIRAKVGTVLDGIMLDAGVSATVVGKPFMDAAVRLNDGSQLHIGIQSSLNKNIESSGSNDANRVGIVLQDDLTLDDGVILDIVGTVSFNGKSLVTGARGVTWSGRNQTWYNAADLTLGGDLTLGATIVFDGTTTSYIIGNGHSIDMNEKTIFIASNHTLSIENATIKNLKGESDGTSSAGAIEMDTGATVKFKDVTILQDANSGYTINRGTVEIVEGGFLKIFPGSTTQDFTLATGSGNFNIKSQASLRIGRNAQFVYNNTTATHLLFEDATSEISLDNSTFKASSNVVFDNGSLIADGKSILDTNSKNIMLNTTFDIVVMPAATLELSGAGIASYGTISWPNSESFILRASERAANDEFGYSVAISGNYAIVGARKETTDGNEAGAAYIFERNTETDIWGGNQTTHYEETTILRASNGTSGNHFGQSVGISGNYAIVGAPHSGTGGEAYIFERSGGVWGNAGSGCRTETKILRSSEIATDDYFGQAVAVSGDYAIVGAVNEDTGGNSAGAAYIFERSGGGVWGDDETSHYEETKILRASDRQTTDFFGQSVAISGSYAIVGAYGEDSPTSNAGAAYIFERSGGGVWGTDRTDYSEETKILRASDRQSGDTFSFSVAISGDYAIAGAYGEDTSGESRGAAYIFERSGGGVWGTDRTDYSEETKILRSSGGITGDMFGYSVAISGNYAIVGATGEDTSGSDSGAAYLFERSDGDVWGADKTTHSEETQVILCSEKEEGDYFGDSVAISGNYAIVGAPYEDSSGNDAGAAYIFKRNE
jgi:hypothetical protein